MRFMNNAIILGVIAAFVLLADCGKGDIPATFISGDIPLKQVVAQSQVIVYATADTNNLPNIRAVIVEVLKGSHEASVAGITNGMQISLQWPANGGTLPDGAILFYHRIPNSEKLEIRSEYMVRGGQVAGMTIQQFKTTFGL
jgi:hypothetical protein